MNIFKKKGTVPSLKARFNGISEDRYFLGAVFCPADASRRFTVRLLVDGEPIAAAIANHPQDNEGIESDCGFRIKVPERLFDTETHHCQFEVTETGRIFPKEAREFRLEPTDNPRMDRVSERKFFFVRGYMKSGTNWLGNLFNLHPEVNIQGEYHWKRFFDAADELSFLRRRYEGEEVAVAYDEAFREPLETLVRQVMKNATRNRALWIGDRTPEPVVPVTLRDARYVYIVRDFRDVLISRAFHFLNRLRTPPLMRRFPTLYGHCDAFDADTQFFSKNPETLLEDPDFVGSTIDDYVENVAPSIDYVEQGGNPGESVRAMVVRYEDLHRDVEKERKRIYEFLELDPSRAAPIDETTSPGFSKERPDQFYRKGMVGDWQNYIFREEAERIHEGMFPLMERLGYASTWKNWVEDRPRRAPSPVPRGQ